MLELILLKSIVISCACVGLRIASSKGMLLYFLRMPYEWLDNELKIESSYLNMLLGREINDNLPKHLQERIKTYEFRKISSTKIIVFILSTLMYILKPIIGCVTCMSSVWTIAIEYAYFELSIWTILIIFIVACLNSIIYAYYEKIKA